MSRITPDAGAMSDLAQLITERKREMGWSYRKLAAQSGGVITWSRWQQLATGVRVVEFPEPETLMAIARGLDVDVTLVVMAAAKSIGLPVRSAASTFAALLPTTVDDIDPDMQDALLRVIRLASRRTDASQKQGTEKGSTSQQSEAAIAADRAARAAQVAEAVGVNPITEVPVPRSKRRSVSESDGRTAGNKRAGDGGRR